MILQEIKTYLQNQNEATITELSKILPYDEALIEMALEQWIQKGKIKTVEPEESCGCSGCTSISCSKEPPVYTWI